MAAYTDYEAEKKYTYEYDADGRVVRELECDIDGSVLTVSTRKDITYNAKGEVSGIGQMAGMAGSYNRVYVYDDLIRGADGIAA